MAPRPKGTDTAAGKGFDTKAPANAADVAYEGGAPVEQETPVFGPQPTQTGPAVAQPMQMVAGTGEPHASPGARVLPGTDGLGVMVGTGLAEAALGNPHLAGVGRKAPLGGVYAPPPQVTGNFEAASVKDEELGPEEFLWNVQNLNIQVTEGTPAFAKDGMQMAGMEPEYLKVRNCASRTHSLEELLPKYWRFCQGRGHTGKELQERARGMAAAVILREKEMCRHPERCGISASSQPTPRVLDPDEALRKQVADRAASQGVSVADFVAGLGAPGMRPVQTANEPKIVQTAVPFDRHRQMMDQRGTQTVEADVAQAQAQAKAVQLGHEFQPK